MEPKTWSVVITTTDNQRISRRYNRFVTHEEIYHEYKKRGIIVENSQISSNKY